MDTTQQILERDWDNGFVKRCRIVFWYLIINMVG